MNWWLAPVLVLAGVIVTAGFNYLIARRKNSGNIDSSDAAVLWAESQSMRKELRDEVVALRSELADVKTNLVKAERENEISHQKIIKLIAQVKQLEKHLKKVGGKYDR